MNEEKNRYFVWFSYDGTRYHGWQVQPSGNSVQAELQRALSLQLREEIEVVGAGRTDAGVHARRMAAHFTQGKPGLPKLSDIMQKGNLVSAKILDPGKGIQQAILCYTDSTEKVYHKRVWKSVPAEIKQNVISAELPAGAHQFFLSAYDEKGRYNDLCGSTSPVILPFPAPEK